MKHVEKIILFVLFFGSIDSFCQSPEPEMADILRQDGKIYTVVLALVIILTALIALLIRVDRKIFQMEKELKQKK